MPPVHDLCSEARTAPRLQLNMERGNLLISRRPHLKPTAGLLNHSQVFAFIRAPHLFHFHPNVRLSSKSRLRPLNCRSAGDSQSFFPKPLPIRHPGICGAVMEAGSSYSPVGMQKEHILRKPAGSVLQSLLITTDVSLAGWCTVQEGRGSAAAGRAPGLHSA